MRLSGITTLVLLVASFATAQEHRPSAADTAIFPPPLEWKGMSRSLVVPKSDPWITPSERAGFRTTPTYDETTAYLRRLDAASDDLTLVSIGKSAQGRDIWMIVASRGGASTAETLSRTGRPRVMAQGGIHSGEIDGKDAGLMLLRDIVHGRKRALLDKVDFLFVPIFNVDGHERAGRYTRINQRGPENGGWRTTAQNYNLNRDYMKADTAEMRAMIDTIDAWKPDLYVDLHVTDGSDYQYDITWGSNGRMAHSPNIAAYLEEVMSPALGRDLNAMGHVPGPLIFEVGTPDPTKGIADWTSDPRFSQGYADLRHIAGILVENHSLKPYEQRVLGTYVFLESLLKTAGESAARLREAVSRDQQSRRSEVPLAWGPTDQPPRTIDYLGVEYRVVPSAISGDLRTEYLGRPKTYKVPVFSGNKATAKVQRPTAYIVPAEWGDVIERLKLHGIKTEPLAAAVDREVTMYRLQEPKFASEPFEGHFTVTTKPAAEKRTERFQAGSVRVPTDQPLGDVAILLLEPSSPDSFVQWGFFAPIFSRTEYVESYMMEPMAEAMLKADPALAKEFEEKLKDEKFRGDSRERLQWFYSKTPFVDDRWRLYPVAREE
jgi:murein tripeptide amidase MpaA